MVGSALGRAVGLAPVLVRTFEQDGYLPSPEEDWEAKLEAALEEAEIEFVDPGVRLRKVES